MAEQMVKEEQPQMAGITPALQKQLGLESVTNAISELVKYSKGVLPADATAKLREVAAYLRGTSPKAENYNTAWFGEQAMKALTNNRLDVAVFAVNIGVGGGMPLLEEKDRKLVSDIVTMERMPEQKTLGTLIIRLQIAATEASVETLKKDFGPGVGGRVGSAAKEARARYEKGDLEGADILSSMARWYSGLVIINNGTGWAGCAAVEAALDTEISGNDGTVQFNAGIEQYRMEVARMQIRERLQFMEEAIGRMRKLRAYLDGQGKLALDARIVGYEARLAELKTRVETLNSREELDLREKVSVPMLGMAMELPKFVQATSFRDRYAGLVADMEMEEHLYRFATVISEQAAINRYDRARAGGDGAILPYIKRADEGFAQAQILLQQGKIEEAKAAYLRAVGEKTMGLAVYSAGMKTPGLRLANAEQFQLPKLELFKRLHGELLELVTGALALDPELRVEQVREKERALTIINTTMIGVKPNVDFRDRQDEVLGLVGEGKLGDAEARMRKTLQIANDYSLAVKGVQDAFSMAIGIGTYFIPVVGPAISSGIFGAMALDEGISEYRATGTVSGQTIFYGMISAVPAVGAYGRGVKALKTGAAVFGGAALGVGAYGTAGLYIAAANEDDPVRRHELLSNAIYGTVFLAPAALGIVPAAKGAFAGARKYAVKGYRFSMDLLRNLDYAFQDFMPLPELAPGRGAGGGHGPMKLGPTKITIIRPGKPTALEMNAAPPQPIAGGGGTGPQGQPINISLTQPAKPPGWIRQQITRIGESIRKSREGAGKMAPPSADQIGTTLGKVVGDIITNPETSGNVVELARQVYRSARETGNKQCWEFLRRVYANDNVRKQMHALAKSDKEIAGLVKETVKNVSNAAAATGTNPQTYLQRLAYATTEGVPAGETLILIDALERQGAGTAARRGKTYIPLAQTEETILGGAKLGATDRATLVLNLEGSTTKVKVGRKTKKLQAVSTDRIGQEALAADLRVQQMVENIPDNHPFTKAFKDGMKTELPKAENVEKAIIETLRKPDAQGAMRTTEGVNLQAVNEALGANNLDGALTAMGQAGQQIRTSFGPGSQFADNVMAAKTLAPRAIEIDNTLNSAANLLASGKKKTFGEAIGGYIEKGVGGLRYAYFGSIDAMRAPGAGKGWKVGTALVVNGLAWYWTGSQLKDLGIDPLVNLLTSAEDVETGRKAVYERFMVNISRESAIFVRSDAGRQLMDYIPALFPKGSERRPETTAQMLDALNKKDIIFDFARLDNVLGDGITLAASLEQINGLLASGNQAGLQNLLEGKANASGVRTGGLGIPGMTLAAVNGLLKKEGKNQLDITDMVDLTGRTDYWVSQGWASRFGNFVMNTFCYDLGMDGDALKANSAFLAANPDVFLALWNRFQSGNLPAAYMEDVINALVAMPDGIAKLRQQAGRDFRAFEQGIVGMLEASKLYLATPIAPDSFLAVLDERPYGMPDKRAADRTPQARARFKKVLNAYGNNPEAIRRFNSFVITPDEDIYGDPNSIATIIASSPNPQAALKSAREQGYVAPGILGIVDPSVIGRSDLAGFAVEHSSRNAGTGGASMESGVCRWVLDNKENIRSLSAILTDLSTKEMAAGLSAGRMYTPKEEKSFLTLQQKSLYEPNGWYSKTREVGGGEKEPGLWTRGWRQAGKPIGLFQEKKVVIPEGFGGPTSDEKELAARKEEQKGRYPRAKMFAPAEAPGETVSEPTLSGEAAAFYNSAGAAALKNLLDGMGMSAGSRQRIYTILTANKVRARAVGNQSSIIINEQSGEIVIRDEAKAKKWLADNNYK